MEENSTSAEKSHPGTPSTRRLAFLAAVTLLRNPSKKTMKRFLEKNGSQETHMSLYRMEKALYQDYGVVLIRQTKYVSDPKDYRYVIRDWGIVCRFRLILRYKDYVEKLMPGELWDDPLNRYISVPEPPSCSYI